MIFSTHSVLSKYLTLPIGREGDTIFDIAPLIAELQSGSLLDRTLTEARETIDLALD